MIEITSKKAGFRRAGIAHKSETVIYPDDRFSEAELAALEAEPMLIVRRVETPQVAPRRKPTQGQPE